MKTEKAGRNDIPQLTELRIAYLKEDYGALNEQEEETFAENLPAYFASHLERDLFCYVIREKDEIISCAFLLVSEKPMSPAFPNGRTGTVLNVYTRADRRHEGCARALINELLTDAERMDLCTVELKSTDAGYPLYRSAGFRDDTSKYRLMKWNNTAYDQKSFRIQKREKHNGSIGTERKTKCARMR